MKRNRLISLITNGVLALVLAVLATVCFLPDAKSVSGGGDGTYRKGTGEGVSLMINVYWGTETVLKMLDVLDEYEATATFFLGGCWADDNVACVKEIASRGHEIGSHGYFHRDHSKMNYKENVEEIAHSVEFISLASGKPVTLFAPPSGAYHEETVNAAQALSLKTVLWTKDTVDWRDKDENICYERATKEVTAGYLVLMHPMEHTLAALPRILRHYRETGLKTISVGENLG